VSFSLGEFLLSSIRLYAVLAIISNSYPPPKGKFSRITHPSATKKIFLLNFFNLFKFSVRLACVKHTASVHPELGSNSQKINIFLYKFNNV
jgi:hypothetical protein